MKELFRISGVRVLVPARSLSAATAALVHVVLLLRVNDDGGAPWVVTVLMLGMAAPVVLGARLFGRLADRADSRHVTAGGALVAATACAGLATNPPLPLLVGLVLLMESGQAMAAPVWSALLPRVVGRGRIAAAVGLQQAVTAAVAPLGAGLGGALYQGYGAAGALSVAAACYLVLSAAPFALRVRRHLGVELEQAEVSAGGFAVLRRDRPLWMLVVAAACVVAGLQGVNVVEVFLARDEIGLSPAQYGSGELAMGVGSLVGALLVGRVAAARRGVGALRGLGVTAAVMVALGLATTYAEYLGWSVVVGLAVAMANGCLGAVLMTRTPDECRGRVSAAVNGLMQGASTVSLVLMGVAGSLIGARATFVLAGVLGLVVVLIGLRVVGRGWADAATQEPPSTVKSTS